MITESSNIRHGYALATWLQRLIAHLIDRLIVGAIVLVGLFGLAVGWRVVVAAAALAFLIYAAWFLSALSGGQTPGKQIVGVRVIRANGEPSGWGLAFVREVIIEWVVVGFLSAMTGGIFYIVNYVWPLWDKDRQALHDKMVETLVVEAAPPATPPGPAPAAR